MRRGQRQAHKSLSRHQHAPSWFTPSIAPDPVQGPTPLAHKFSRVLARLVKGEKLQRVGKFWKWIKNSGGKVKATLLFNMRNLGLLNCIGGNWLITAYGKKVMAL